MICAGCYQNKHEGKMYEKRFYCMRCLVEEKAKRVKASSGKTKVDKAMEGFWKR